MFVDSVTFQRMFCKGIRRSLRVTFEFGLRQEICIRIVSGASFILARYWKQSEAHQWEWIDKE